MKYQQRTKVDHKEQQKMPASSLHQASLDLGNVHPLLELQRTIGNQAVLKLLQSQRTQNNAMAQPGMESLPDHDSSQRAARSSAVAHGVLNSSGGQPLDPTTRAVMEARFGHDFSHVRVHTDAAAARAASDWNARAFTRDHHIHFGGSYDLSSPTDGVLLAHELTHVVQADMAALHPEQPISSVDVLEREATHVATTFRQSIILPPIHGLARNMPVPLRSGPDDDPGVPTFGNLPKDAPVCRRRVELIKGEGNKWHEIVPRSDVPRRTARGSYDFVVQDGHIWAVKEGVGHTEAARGGRVTWAGKISFSNKGMLKMWDNASGHYLPVGSLEAHAEKVHSDLEYDKYYEQSHLGPVVRPDLKHEGPQLPTFQLKKGEVMVPRRELVTPSGGAPKPVTSVSGEITVLKETSPRATPKSVDISKELGSDTTRTSATTVGSSPHVEIGSIGAIASAVGAAAIDMIVVPIINHYLEEHFADMKAKGIRKLTAQAIANARQDYLKVIEDNRMKIQKANAQGRPVYLCLVIEAGYADSTDRDPIVGSGLSSGYWPYLVNVVDIQIVSEGETIKPYVPDTSWIGDLFRDIVGNRFEYSYLRIPL